jgi:hypothetical protein
MENSIKVLLKSACPHCGKELLVEVEMPTPDVKNILTEGDILAAKEHVKKELSENKSITTPALEQALAWLNEETTVFGPGDVDEVLKSILNEKKYVDKAI